MAVNAEGLRQQAMHWISAAILEHDRTLAVDMRRLAQECLDAARALEEQGGKPGAARRAG
jgi:hypothetical protein